MSTRYLDPKNDVAFKKIFGSENHKDLLINFLESILGLEGDRRIQSLEFLSPIQLPNRDGLKLSIVDISCQDHRGIRYIVEIQVAHHPGFAKRAQFYSSILYTNQLKEGSGYPTLNQVVFLAIVDHVLFPEKQFYKSNHTTRDDITNEHDLKDFRYVFVELPKFNKTLENLETIEDKWLYFLKHAHQEENIPNALETNHIQEAYETLERYKWNESEMIAYMDSNLAVVDYEYGMEYSHQEGLKQGEQIGLAKGEQIGAHHEKLAIAKRMLEQNIAEKIILACSGLSASELRELQKNL